MLKLICRRNLGCANEFCFLQFYSFSSLTISKSKFNSGSETEYPFAVNYLINKVGCSREWALKAYSQVKFRSSKNPDAVIALFKKLGFSDAQILRIIRNSPRILVLKPQDNLLPKIEFLLSLGISSDDIVNIVTYGGYIMTSSLENRIIPSFDFIKNMLKSNEDVIFAIKRFPGVLTQDLHKQVPLNAEILRKAGVPDVKILHLFKRNPRFLLTNSDEFKKYVERLKEMGFDPVKSNFLEGIIVMRSFTKLSWNYKMDVYKRWGYSEDQILLAFRRYPRCMAVSEDKIEGALDYIINKMGCDPLVFIGSPPIFFLSLEKTIIPRCSVYRVLKSKGLIRKNTLLAGVLKHSKETFLERFVLPFAEKVPELLKLYPCNLNPVKGLARLIKCEL